MGKRKPRANKTKSYKLWLFPLKSCRVYDGDTLMEMVLDVGFGISFQTTGRLVGINAPEIKGASKRAGVRARDWLRESIEDASVVHIETVSERLKRQQGKYGRWLVTVWADGVDLNDEIVRLGHAKKARY